jgi:hypothetical protein
MTSKIQLGMGARIATLRHYINDTRVIAIGLFLAVLSQVAKYLGKLGSKTEGIEIGYTGVIRHVIDPNKAKEVREDILGDFHLIVENYKSPQKPERGGWTLWHLAIIKGAKDHEETLNRGETFASLSLAAVAIPLAFIPLGQVLSAGLSILSLLFSVVLVSAVSLRIAVIDLLAFTDPQATDRTRLKNMWAWNHWILDQTAVMVVILGIVLLGKIRSEMRHKTVREIRELPRRISEGEEINQYEVVKRIARAGYRSEVDSQPEDE